MSDASTSGLLDVLRSARDFRLLLSAAVASGFGTYLAAIALTVDVFDRTGSGVWVSALLLAEFAPTIAIGLTLGPLVDRLSRRRLMIVADLARAAVFFALPFVPGAGWIVGLAAMAGIANGFFRPATYASLPNLVQAKELAAANSLFHTLENVSWMIGPLVGGALVAGAGPAPAYVVNGASFVVSAAFLARIPAQRLQGAADGKPERRRHLRDLQEGFVFVLRSRTLRTVLVAWTAVLFGHGLVNVAEVVFAKVSLGAGDFGFGLLVGATGLGLTLGSLAASRLLDRWRPIRVYALSIGLMSMGFGAAAAAPSIWAAAALVVLAATGNGVAVVANGLLAQQSAPDRLRGRVLSVLMSVTLSSLALGYVLAGPLTDAFGGRWVWAIAAIAYAVASIAALLIGGRGSPETDSQQATPSTFAAG